VPNKNPPEHCPDISEAFQFIDLLSPCIAVDVLQAFSAHSAAFHLSGAVQVLQLGGLLAPLVQEHTPVAGQKRAAGVLVEQEPLPPTQEYAGVDAPSPQAEGHVGAVQVPVGVTQLALAPFHTSGAVQVLQVG
jgi:hypothetical protein